MDANKTKVHDAGGIKKRWKRPPPKPVEIGPDGIPRRPRLMRDILPQIHSHPGWASLPQLTQLAVDMVRDRGHLYHIIYEVWDHLYLGTPLPP